MRLAAMFVLLLLRGIRGHHAIADVTPTSPDLAQPAQTGDAEFTARLAKWKAPEPRYKHGVFSKYAALVSSASVGAVTVVNP